MNSRKVVIVIDAAPLHRWPDNLNVEHPGRIVAIQESLTASNCQCISPPPLHPRTRDAITAVHTLSYVQSLQQACADLCEGKAHVLADPEIPAEYTYVTRHSYNAAVGAVSACLHAADAAAGVDPVPWFVAVRPPGHHAMADQASGFCLLSNVAIMVAIVDFDVHHGNGTQAAFYDDPNVLFIDIHQAGVWPGSGRVEECGEGAGLGTTLNVPLPVGAGDRELQQAWETQVEPRLTSFQPAALVASAGFDAHTDDPLGQLQYSDEAYHFLGSALVAAARRLCGGRCVAVLEGGYDPVAMGRSAVQLVCGMDKAA